VTRIDVLINNAGFHAFKPRVTTDGCSEMVAVNYLAPWLLTNILRETVINSAPSRIVTVASEASRQAAGFTAFIGGDNFKIAEEAGKYVADKLLPQGGEVAVLEGLPSSTPAVERLNGFKAGVKDNAKIDVVAEQAADWLPDKAQTAFAAMLRAHPNIKAVYASNDMMAAGARLAAKGAGKLDQVKILGTDGLPGPAGGIRAVAEGEWAATFTYPTGGPEAIEMAKSILLDCAEKVPTVVTVPTTAITSDNAKQLMRN
jgi:ribose transport system substrate-binding protein